MNTIIEVKPSNKYVIQRDDEGIQNDMAPIERNCNLLNALVNLMAVTDYELTTEEEVTQVISKGATQYVKEKIVAHANREAFKKVFGFTPDDSHLMQVSEVPDAVKKAEAITTELRNNLKLTHYHFNGREFVIKPEVKQNVVDNRTRYAHNRHEAKLISKLRDLVTEFNSLREAMIEYVPNDYGNHFTHPENIFKWLPETRSYEVDISAVVKMFDSK